MLKCIECLRLISDLIDNELGFQSGQKLIARIAGYEECQACLHTLKKTVTLYRSFHSVEVPREVHASFWHVMEVEIYKPASKRKANQKKVR